MELQLWLVGPHPGCMLESAWSFKKNPAPGPLGQQSRRARSGQSKQAGSRQPGHGSVRPVGNHVNTSRDMAGTCVLSGVREGAAGWGV